MKYTAAIVKLGCKMFQQQRKTNLLGLGVGVDDDHFGIIAVEFVNVGEGGMDGCSDGLDREEELCIISVTVLSGR